MDDFTSALMRAYQIGSQNRKEREQRQALTDFSKSLADDSAQVQASAKDKLAANPNYQFGQSHFNDQAKSLNDLIAPSSFSLQPETDGNGIAPTLNSVLASAKPAAPASTGFTAPSQLSLNSLLSGKQPQSTQPAQQPMNYAKAQPMQEFDFSKYNGLLAKGLESGVDPNAAFSMLNNYKKNYDEQYNKSREDEALKGILSAEPKGMKNAFINYARATGKMDAATLRGLLSTNTVKHDDGANINFYRTDSFGNPVDVGKDGTPVPWYSVEKKMSLSEQDASKRGWKGLEVQERGLEQDLYKFNNVSGNTAYAVNHRAASGGDAIFSKAETAALTKTNATINAFNSRWKDPFTGELREGYQQDPLFQSYQQAITIQNQIYAGSVNPQSSQQPPGQVNYYDGMQKVTRLMESGKVSKEQIIAAVQQDYGDLASYILRDAGLLGGDGSPEKNTPIAQPDIVNPETGLRQGSVLDNFKTKGNLGVAQMLGY